MLFLFLNIHSLFRIEFKKKARPTTAEQYIPSWMKNCVWQRFYFLTKQPVQYTHTVPGLKSPEGISMIDAFLSTDCFTFFRLTNSCETWITPGNETTENQSGTNLTSQLWCTWRLLLTSDWGLTFSQLNGQPALTSVFWFAPFFFFFSFVFALSDSFAVYWISCSVHSIQYLYGAWRQIACQTAKCHVGFDESMQCW